MSRLINVTENGVIEGNPAHTERWIPSPAHDIGQAWAFNQAVIGTIGESHQHGHYSPVQDTAVWAATRMI